MTLHLRTVCNESNPLKLVTKKFYDIFFGVDKKFPFFQPSDGKMHLLLYFNQNWLVKGQIMHSNVIVAKELATQIKGCSKMTSSNIKQICCHLLYLALFSADSPLPNVITSFMKPLRLGSQITKCISTSIQISRQFGARQKENLKAQNEGNYIKITFKLTWSKTMRVLATMI